MNIILSAGLLGKFPFANNNIQISLADTLSKQGHTCYICGVSYEKTPVQKTENGSILYRHTPKNIFTKAMQKFEGFLSANGGNADQSALIRKFVFLCPFSSILLFAYRYLHLDNTAEKSYVRFLKDFASKNNIDALVCFAYPFDMAKAIILCDSIKQKKFYYQLDPHGLHETLDQNNMQARISDEVSVIEKADFSITTKILYHQYCNHPQYSHLANKLAFFEFPTLQIKPKLPVAPIFDFKQADTNILFCGTINDIFRNPEFLLNTFQPILKNNKNIKLFFVGPNVSKILSEQAALFPTQIFVHPAVENKFAVAAMQQADFLINIGNSITNMMPSKIFDYFAIGKPILNFQKIENCPAQEYFEKYPLQITIEEFANEQVTEKIETFLQSKKGQAVAYSDVEKTYHTATVKYVATELISIIKNSF